MSPGLVPETTRHPGHSPHSDAGRRVSATSTRPRAGGQGRRGDPVSTGPRQVTPGRGRPQAPHSPSAAARPRGRLHAGPSQRSLLPYCYLALSDPAARHPMAARSRGRHHQAALRRGCQCASAARTHALQSTWGERRSRTYTDRHSNFGFLKTLCRPRIRGCGRERQREIPLLGEGR